MENRLSQISFAGGGTVTYKYDPFGRRIYRSGPSGTTIWLYDGANIVNELNGAGAVQATYTQGSGVDEPLAMLRAAITDYYEADGLGSVTSLSDFSGAIAETYTYDSYGKLTAAGATLNNPFRYTGREWDADAGLYYYRARYLDAAAGRFVNEDPISLLGGLNLFRYVDNQPTIFNDPSGLMKPVPPNKRKNRDCRPDEEGKCITQCESEGKTMQSCKISQTFRLISTHNGYGKYEWKDGPMSCSCNEDDNDPRNNCKRVRKGFGLYNGPTNFEIQKTIESTQNLTNFWKWVVVGDGALLVVGTAGAAGFLGGGAAAGAGASGASGSVGTAGSSSAGAVLIPAA